MPKTTKKEVGFLVKVIGFLCETDGTLKAGLLSSCFVSVLFRKGKLQGQPDWLRGTHLCPLTCLPLPLFLLLPGLEKKMGTERKMRWEGEGSAELQN